MEVKPSKRFRLPSLRLEHLLQAWQTLVIGALLGGILGWGGFLLFPSPYQAQATVIVDHNAEQVLPSGDDRDVAIYLSRETRKLEEIAWSDEVLQQVVDEVGDFTLEALRGDKLLLSQPGEGGWHFWGRDRDPQMAAALASSWARGFVRQVEQGVKASVAMDTIRQTLEATEGEFGQIMRVCTLVAEVDQRLDEIGERFQSQEALSPLDGWRLSELAAWMNWSGTPLAEQTWFSSGQDLRTYLEAIKSVVQDRQANCQTAEEQYSHQLLPLEERLKELQAQSLGVSPYLEVISSQLESLPVERTIPLGAYMFFGSFVGVVISLIWAWVGTRVRSMDDPSDVG
jgi:capsular polysaccharide biosynthesis protein